MTLVCVAVVIFLSLGIRGTRADHLPIVVAPDGSGHFKTVQSAIDSVPNNNTKPRVVVLKPGRYKERLVIERGKTFHHPSRRARGRELGRPWQKGAAVAFIGCELSNHLRPEGWSENPGNDHHKSTRYVEYNNTGPRAVPHQRPAWTRQLDVAEAQRYTVGNILSGEDRWNPQR